MSVKVLDFSASWCFPCKLQAPIIDKLSDVYKKAKFEKIDIDAEKEKAMKYGIKAVPTIVVVKDDKEVTRFVGVTAEKELIKVLDKLMK